MLLFDDFVSIVETLLMGGRAELGSPLLVYTLSQGSADKSTLRTHATKAMLTDDNPEDAFSVRYALEIINEPDLNARVGQLVRKYFN